METETPTSAPAMPPPAGPKNNTMAITSLCLGIASFVLLCLAAVSLFIPLIGFFSLICGGLGILLGIAALITGIMAYNQIKNSGEPGNGMALAGMVMGGLQILIVVCILPVILIAAVTLMGPLVGQVFSTINSSLK